MKVTKNVMYDALYLAALDVMDAVKDKENGCKECPVQDDCDSTGDHYCFNLLIGHYIETSIALNKQKKRIIN